MGEGAVARSVVGRRRALAAAAHSSQVSRPEGPTRGGARSGRVRALRQEGAALRLQGRAAVARPAWPEGPDAAWALVRQVAGAKPGLMEALTAALPNSSFLDIHRAAVGNATSNSTNASSVLSNETLQQCVDRKKELTSQVVAARQLARQGRSKVALLNSTINVISAWESMLSSEVFQAFEVNEDFQDGWTRLQSSVENQVYESGLANAKADLQEVTENVSNYVGLDTVHGSVLPSMMSSLEQKFQFFSDNFQTQVASLLADYADAEKHLVTNIDMVSKELNQIQVAAGPLHANLTAAQALVDQAVEHEQELLSERAAVEAECEQALR